MHIRGLTYTGVSVGRVLLHIWESSYMCWSTRQIADTDPELWPIVSPLSFISLHAMFKPPSLVTIMAHPNEPARAACQPHVITNKAHSGEPLHYALAVVIYL